MMDTFSTPIPNIERAEKVNLSKETCEYWISQTKDIDDDFTITNLVIYRNESELNPLEIFVRDKLKYEIEDSRTEVYIYCIMFIMGFIGNLFVLFSLYKNDRKSKRRENTLFIHLSVVDLLIIVIIVPIELIWKLTYVWEMGIFLCKAFQFLKNYFM